MLRQAFNDMFGKGWDSARQESYCWQKLSEGDPQFWWVPHVFDKWGHAGDWSKHKRDDKGRYKIFPKSPIKTKDPIKSEISVKLLRLATFFSTDQQQYVNDILDIVEEIESQE